MKVIATVALIACLSLNIRAGIVSFHRNIEWKPLITEGIGESDTLIKAYFDGAKYGTDSPGLPVFSETFPLPAGVVSLTAKLSNIVYDVAPEGFEHISGAEQVKNAPVLKASLSFDRKIPFAYCSMIPARINPYNGEYELVKSFDIEVDYNVETAGSSANMKSRYAGNSVLASGNWYKLAVVETGIHQITYTDLQKMGIDPSSIDPKNIRIYGNGGGMLPESLGDYRQDDLAENNIFVSGESDGHFDQQDYVLFYGESPNKWVYQSINQAFNHIQNIYSDSTYYFLTTDLGPGQRIPDLPSVTEPADIYVSKFTDYAYHELDEFNLSNIGRVWYGEIFDVSTSYDFKYDFPNIDISSPAYFRAYVAAKSESPTSFKFYDGNSQIMSAMINGLPSSSNSYALPYIGSNWFNPSSSAIDIRINFQKSLSNSLGWLNYFEINVVRNLIFTGGQMSFRNPAAGSPGTIAEFTLGNAGQNVQIWEVSNPKNARKVGTHQSGGNMIFRLAQDTLSEFIAFDGSSYYPVYFSKKIKNQNLHSTPPTDMVIITNPLFNDQAQRLAAYHRETDDLSVMVTDIGSIYNEFSSGAQDITAIRDFMKLLYDEAPSGKEPKYLLLFGDASFDYKDRIKDNSNFVPTWEDEESLTVVYSIASDDYYGFLDGPGDNMLDLGIGRLPVETEEQARVAVDKIIHYATNAPAVMKEWRNYICFVADDEDGNMHLDQAEDMAAFIDTTYKVYNIDKIYVDAFPQISTPGGQRAPAVNAAINDRINKGCVIMNYTGHGGEVGWGHERFLENSDINSWTNYDRMPIFITATCEFSRYDDPERVSAGEYTFRNPNGGAVAMFTTARATFGGSNFNLNTALFDYIFEKNNGDYYCFGDLIRLAKNRGGVETNDKKFILLGDPALHLAYPENQVVTTRINESDIESSPDTLQALRTITVEGEVQYSTGGNGNFNGTLYPIVFDKPSNITTLATDPKSYAKTFKLQNSILYKGKAQVTDGKFSFTFIVPKDISYQYGFGKISYYAANDKEDAHGYYRNIIVGGLDQTVDPDTEGPNVRLFINDSNFVFGGITDENPIMVSFVNDANGINTVGSGIGHDIVAILDGDTEKPIILNDFYESDLNSYTSGSIRYPFHNLSQGLHTLSLKVWDVFNNSSDAYIEFNVIPSTGLTINEVINYPNPVTNGTTFVFSHNQTGGQLDASLIIYDLNGRMVYRMEKNFTPEGYRSEPFYWNGNSETGESLAKGMYIYRINIRNEEGATAGKSGKLILIR